MAERKNRAEAKYKPSQEDFTTIIRISRTLAKQLNSGREGIREDLASEGVARGLSVISDYSAESNTNLAAYLAPHIRGALLDYLRKEKSHRRLVSQSAARGRNSSEDKSKTPAPGKKKKTIDHRTAVLQTLPDYLKFLEEKGLNSGKDGMKYNPLIFYIEWLKGKHYPDPEKSVLRNLTSAQIRKILGESLKDLAEKDPRGAKIAILYYFGGMTMKEIGAKVGMTEGRVSHIITGSKDTIGVIDSLRTIIRRRISGNPDILRHISD